MEASELKEILDQHKLWIETNGVQGKRADLSYADLTGANLLDAILTDAKIDGANLTGANLKGAILTAAYLYGANLYGANLEDADFTGADLTSANFTDADLTNAYLMNAYLGDANLTDADLTGAYLLGAYLLGANLTGAIGLPDIFLIIPGCLVQLNQIIYGFYLAKERKHENFIQDSIGFFIQDNSEEKTFDMLVGDRIIRNIPDWVKYSGIKQVATESV